MLESGSSMGVVSNGPGCASVSPVLQWQEWAMEESNLWSQAWLSCIIMDKLLIFIHACMHASIHPLIHPPIYPSIFPFNKCLQRTNSGPDSMRCPGDINMKVLPLKKSESRTSINILKIVLIGNWEQQGQKQIYIYLMCTNIKHFPPKIILHKGSPCFQSFIKSPMP